MKREPEPMYWITGVPIMLPEHDPRLTKRVFRLLLIFIASLLAFAGGVVVFAH